MEAGTAELTHPNAEVDRNGSVAGGRRWLRRGDLIGFGTSFGLTLLLALDGGGYDVVLRQEVGIATWVAIALGLAAGVLPRAQLNTGARWGLGGLAALATLMLLAHSWTQSDERTTVEMCRALQYLGLVTLAYLALNRRSWRGAGAGFAAAALLVPLFAVGSRLFPHLLVDHVSHELRIDRLSYPFDYWNAVSCWGAMAVAIGLCVSAHAPQRLVRSAALALVPVAVLSVQLAYSRFGIAAVPIALLASFALSRHRWTLVVNAAGGAAVSAVVVLVTHGESEIARGTGSSGAATVILVLIAAGAVCAGLAAVTVGMDARRLSRRSARLALAGAGVALLIAIAGLHGPISRGWDQFNNDRPEVTGSDPTVRLTSLGGNRHAMWVGAWDAFETDPSRGIGPGSYEFYWDQHGNGTQFIRNPHSLYLEQLAELGVPGLIAILIGLGGLLFAAIRAWRRWISDGDIAIGAGLIAAFIVFAAYAAVDWMWEVGAVGTLALGGCAVAGASGFAQRRPTTLNPWVMLAALIGCLLVAASQVPTLVSVERTRASGAALADGDPSRAEDLARQAIDAEPWAASPYAASALAYQAMGRVPDARREIDEAIDRQSTDWRYPLIRGRIDAASGNRQEVVADLATVRRLAPRSLYLSPGSPYLLDVKRLIAGARKGPPREPGP